MRIVYEEDGYPRELLNLDECERAIRSGALSAATAVTVYRTGQNPRMMAAAAVEEIRPLLDLPPEFAAGAAPDGPSPDQNAGAAAPAPMANPIQQPLSAEPLGRHSGLDGAPRDPRGNSSVARDAARAPAEAEPCRTDTTLERTAPTPDWQGPRALDDPDVGASVSTAYRPKRYPILVVVALVAIIVSLAYLLDRTSGKSEPALETVRVVRTTNVRAGPGIEATVVVRLRAGSILNGSPSPATGKAEWFLIGSGALAGRYVWLRNVAPIESRAAYTRSSGSSWPAVSATDRTTAGDCASPWCRTSA